jgi:hypothetical protein
MVRVSELQLTLISTSNVQCNGYLYRPVPAINVHGVQVGLYICKECIQSTSIHLFYILMVDRDIKPLALH